MNLVSTLKESILGGLVEQLDKGLRLLKGKLAAEGEADEHVKKACVIVVTFDEELRTLADKTDNEIDNELLDELLEFAESVLPAPLVAGLKDLNFVPAPTE